LDLVQQVSTGFCCTSHPPRQYVSTGMHHDRSIVSWLQRINLGPGRSMQRQLPAAGTIDGDGKEKAFFFNCDLDVPWTTS
jgi:hypothetical protein